METEQKTIQMKDSDMIFTQITTGNFDNFEQVSHAVFMLYIPDMSISRAGISHALKRLEKHYNSLNHQRKKFSITYSVIKASGTVTYTVEAETREDAIKMLKSGKGDITSNEVEPSYAPVNYEKEVYED